MFGSGASIQLARIAGIRLGANPSWFVVLFIFIFLLSERFIDVLGSEGTGYAVAVAAVLLFFISLVAHEFGHAIVAQRNGIKILGIDLWFFGGVARLDRDTPTPGIEFRVSAAGPLVTFVLALAFGALGVALVGSEQFWRLISFQDLLERPGAAEVLLAFLCQINVFLLVFNLIPAFPLDGGRIARAIAWKLTGDKGKATRASAALGQGFAVLMAGYAIFVILAGGEDALFNGLWLLVLAYFLGTAARNAAVQTRFQEQIADVRVQDIMDAEPVVIPSAMTATDAEEVFFLRYQGWPWFAVVDDAGRFQGIIERERVQGAVAAGDGARTVAEVMEPDDGDGSVPVNEPLEALLGSTRLRGSGALFAVDPDGRLRGVVTMDQVRRALASATR